MTPELPPASHKIATQIADHPERFKSNTAHAQFAADVAATLHAADGPVMLEAFMAAAMPRWMVGTAKSNPWINAEHKLTRSAASPSTP